MKVRPLNDWVLIELEGQDETYENTSIVRVGDNPVRVGKVLAVGPGRQYPDKYVATVLKPGERVAFFIAATECGSGPSINYHLGDNKRMIREPDVLVVLDGKASVTV